MVNIVTEVCYNLQKVPTDPLLRIAELIERETFYNKATVYLAGNGGSSATMSHLASDLSKLGISTKCLIDNVPELTAGANDDGWDQVYVSMVAGKVRAGDILILASVNGSTGVSPDGQPWSSNLLELAWYFRQECAYIVVFSGNNGGNLSKETAYSIVLESKDPYVVESVHSVWAHALVSEIKTLQEKER